MAGEEGDRGPISAQGTGEAPLTFELSPAGRGGARLGDGGKLFQAKKRERRAK